MSNSNEWIAGTDPSDPASVFRITNVVPTGANMNVTFTTVLGRNYTLESSNDLFTWTPIGGGFVGTGSPIATPVGPITGFPKLFVRVRVAP